jgi:glycosyltransferase involved in cell wall biosynthesis
MNHSKPKIAMLLPNLDGGGAQRVFAYLARGLADHGYPVDMLLASARGPYLADLPRAVRVVPLGAQRAMASVPSLVRYLRAERPSCLLSALDHTNVAAILAARLAGTSTRVIASVHVAHSRTHALGKSLRQRAVWFAIRRCYPWAKAVVAVSKGIARDLIATTRVPERLIRVVYNPVLTPEFDQLAQEQPSHPWFTAGAPKVIVAVGGLLPAKDHRTLIRAFAVLRRECNARLVILGEGPLRLELEALVRSLGLSQDVDLPGFTRNPFAYLSHASLFVLSSAWEALPTVLIEALATNVPIVATDCPYGPSEILDHGRYGRLVPVGDIQAMAEAMRACLNSLPRQRPLSLLQPFTLEAAAAKYQQIVCEVNRA